MAVTEPYIAVQKTYCHMYTDRINPDYPEGRLLITSSGFELKDPTLPLSQVSLESKAHLLMKYLKEKAFESRYSKHMDVMYKVILEHNAQKDLGKYNVILKKYPKERTFIYLWLLYDFYDMLPTFKRIHAESNYYKLTPYYRSIVDSGMRVAQSTGIQDTTISVEASMVSSFFCYLIRSKVDTLALLTECLVRNYTRSGHCGPMILYRISVFLRRYAYHTDDQSIISIIHYFPKENRTSKIYPALTHEERVKLENFLLSENTLVSKRDRAIVVLMLYSGMRSKDVANLMVSDIDWSNNVIRFKQSKTLGSLTLPLRPVVGNAIYDYIINERPKCSEQRLFLSHEAHSGRYGSCSIATATNRIYALAGIRLGNERQGTHLLRHSLADEMINEGNDVTMVAKTLGHLSPNTSLGYMSSNIDQLRACALSIESYPVTHKLYSHE